MKSTPFEVKQQLPIAHKRALNRLQLRLPKLRGAIKNVLKVELANIIVGDMQRVSSYDWYRLTGDHSRLEQPLEDSPYVDLFRRIERGELPGDYERLPYYQMARMNIERLGGYMGRRRVEELPRLIDHLDERFHEYRRCRESGSIPTNFVLLRAVHDARLYEVVEGHHRLAMDLVLGRPSVHAYVVGRGYSGIQRKLFDVHMTKRKELYQPVSARSVEAWPTVRRCYDRLRMMNDWFEAHSVELAGRTMIDLACSYGYFVKAFKDRGMQSLGVDVDQNALDIGRIQYGLTSEDLVQSSLQQFLQTEREPLDLVCCFSILHHFQIGRDFGPSPMGVADLLGAVGRLTGRFLVLDSGQAHEAWIRRDVPAWDDQYVIRLVQEHTGLHHHFVLGRDQDNVGKYSGNYNRTLFLFAR